MPMGYGDKEAVYAACEKQDEQSAGEKDQRLYMLSGMYSGIGAGILFLSALGAGQPGMGGREQDVYKRQMWGLQACTAWWRIWIPS